MVIIDCPPSLGVLTLNGLTAADDVIVPLQCETLAHRGVGQFLRTVTDVQQITNADLTMLGALPTLYDSRTTHSRDVLLDVADRYGLPVLAPPIPRTVRFAEASASGASVIAGRKNKGALRIPRAGLGAAQALEVGQGTADLHPGALGPNRRRSVRPRCSPRSTRQTAGTHRGVPGGKRRPVHRDAAFTHPAGRIEHADTRRSRGPAACSAIMRRGTQRNASGLAAVTV